MELRRPLNTAAALVGLFAAGPAYAAGAPQTFAPAELRADLVELKRALHDMPPDLSRTTDLAQLERAFRDIDSELDSSPPLDRDATWRLFATLNPILADGHLLIGFVDWRGDTRAHLAAGGVLFPFEVRVTPECIVQIRAALGGGATPLEHLRLRSINREAAHEVCEQMLARAHGDSREFRADLLSRRFWFFYWKIFGAPPTFQLEFIDRKGSQSFAGASQLPQVLDDEASFERQFSLTEVAEDTMVLKLGSFAWPDKSQYLEFTRASFQKMREMRTMNLIIDLRDNGGGNDEMWIEGLMPYIATKAWRTGSTFRKRVVVANPEKGEVVGSVVNGEIETWYPAQPGNPLRFNGRVFVVVGPGTYSSAVVLSNVVQDFEFGMVAGIGGSVRANLSGGVRRTTLTHCGLIVAAPRFVLNRPSGARDPVWFMPDVHLNESTPLKDVIHMQQLEEVVSTSQR